MTGLHIIARALRWRLYPAMRELVKATKKKSPGGKRVTKGEKRKIVRKFLGAAEEIVNEDLEL